MMTEDFKKDKGIGNPDENSRPDRDLNPFNKNPFEVTKKEGKELRKLLKRERKKKFWEG